MSAIPSAAPTRTGPRGPYGGNIIGFTGTSPGPVPLYTVAVHMPDGVKTYTGVRPSVWSWSLVGIDEDAEATVAASQEARGSTGMFWVAGDKLVAFFIPAPHVKDCPPPGPGGGDSPGTMLLNAVRAMNPAQRAELRALLAGVGG